MVFELPVGVTGFGVDVPAAEAEARRDAFVSWGRAVAASLDSPLVEIPLGEPVPSFDAIHLERIGRWVLHNRYVPLAGVLARPPEPGESWAVAGDYVDLELADHVTGWGPEVIGASTLNGPVGFALDQLGYSARQHGDRYKPQTTGHVLFNYWRG